MNTVYLPAEWPSDREINATPLLIAGISEEIIHCHAATPFTPDIMPPTRARNIRRRESLPRRRHQYDYAYCIFTTFLYTVIYAVV